MRRHRALLPVVTLCALLQPAWLRAQSGVPADGRMDVAIDAVWIGPIAFSGADAVERNGAGDPYRLFAARSRLESVVGYGARVAVRVSKSAQLETSMTYGTPDVSVHVSSDTEDAASVRVAESVTQIQIDGGLVASLGRPRLGPHNVPFVSAGVAYVRELHEGKMLALNGWSYFAGGGLKHFLKTNPAARVKGIGLRFDARIVLRIRGVGFDERVHLLPAVAGSFFVRL